MKARGDYKPKGYEYEVLNDGTAVLRFFENVKKFTDKGEDDRPDVTGYEYDVYTLSRPHSDHLSERVAADPDAWLAFAKQQEADDLAVCVRARRDVLLVTTDRTQLPDADIAECCRDEYKAYRQRLRDIPGQPGFPYEVEWPDEPVTEKAAR